jgi:uncharacterized membrane protein YidH (DUF202 family)
MRKLIYGFTAMMALLAGQVAIDVARAEEAVPAVEVEMPTMKEMATGVLKSIIEAAAAAKDFLSTEIPLVIQELLTYYTALYAAYAVLGVVLIVVGVLWHRKWWKVYCDAEDATRRADRYTDNSGWACLAIAGLLITSIPGLFLMYNVVALLKITLAPRIWLIEYARNLL